MVYVYCVSEVLAGITHELYIYHVGQNEAEAYYQTFLGDAAFFAVEGAGQDPNELSQMTPEAFREVLELAFSNMSYVDMSALTPSKLGYYGSDFLWYDFSECLQFSMSYEEAEEFLSGSTELLEANYEEYSSSLPEHPAIYPLYASAASY